MHIINEYKKMVLGMRIEPFLLRKYKKLHRKYLHLLKNMVIQCQVEFPLN